MRTRSTVPRFFENCFCSHAMAGVYWKKVQPDFKSNTVFFAVCMNSIHKCQFLNPMFGYSQKWINRWNCWKAYPWNEKFSILQTIIWFIKIFVIFLKIFWSIICSWICIILIRGFNWCVIYSSRAEFDSMTNFCGNCWEWWW